MKHIKTFEQFVNESVNESNLANDFNVGDHVIVNKKEKFKQLIGKKGKVIDTDLKKGIVFIDFGEKLKYEGEFITWDLDGKIKTDTGLIFQDRGWVSSKLDPRFDLRNIDKI